MERSREGGGDRIYLPPSGRGLKTAHSSAVYPVELCLVPVRVRIGRASDHIGGAPGWHVVVAVSANIRLYRVLC